MLGGNNSNFEAAEQRIYADHEHKSLSLLERLGEKFDDMTTEFRQMKQKLNEFESKISKLESAVNELSTILKSNTEHDGHHNQSKQRVLNLQFSDKISSPVRTGEEIKGVGGNYLRVTLVNETGELVDSGPESSAEVHVFALKGDIDDENEGDSGEKKIKKETVLAGDLQLKLNKGIGNLVNIKFRRSSKHFSGRFMIGARIVVDSFHSAGVVVKDAKSPSFTVKDYRGKYNEKHRPPCLCDEVWRLDNIGKGGSIHDCLKKRGLYTVGDFLIELLKDSGGLEQAVDLPPRKWEATVKHAMTCQLDEKIYCSTHPEENRSIVFNAIGKVLGLIIENKYCPLDKLSHEDKVYASTVDVAAFVHKRGLNDFPNEASVVQRFVGLAEPLQHPSQLTPMSENAADHHEDEVSETVVDGIPSTYSSWPPFPIDNDNWDIFYGESPFAASDSYQNTTSFSDMLLHESPPAAGSDKEVRKKLFLFFTITKWLLKLERMASATADCSDTNDNQKRRRIS